MKKKKLLQQIDELDYENELLVEKLVELEEENEKLKEWARKNHYTSYIFYLLDQCSSDCITKEINL